MAGAGPPIVKLLVAERGSGYARDSPAHCHLFVAVDAVTGQVAAYYTLSAASIAFTDLSPDVTKNSSRYPTLPAVRIGCLAVVQRFQEEVWDPPYWSRLPTEQVSAMQPLVVLVDAKNEAAVEFYRRYGFRNLVGAPNPLSGSGCKKSIVACEIRP